MSNGGTGRVIYQDDVHLHGPLAMVQAPNGDLLVSNADVINSDPNQPSEIVEFTTGGRFVKQLSMDLCNQAALSASTCRPRPAGLARFAAVDDNAGTVTIWSLPPL